MSKAVQDANAQFIEFVSVAPEHIKTKGDCTTRCISLCTGVDYMTIREEQFLNSAYSGVVWRCRDVWERSLTSRGFRVIHLPCRISRRRFIKIFGNDIENGMVATGSFGHVAAIDMKKKKVLDTWDSTGGHIKYIYVHSSQYEMFRKAIEARLG